MRSPEELRDAIRAQAGQFRLVGDLSLSKELIEADRQRHEL
jgi:hypothetical protein